MSQSPTIIYTMTDEAPALATYSLLPIVRAFASQTGVAFDLRDISLAGRILAVFPECLTEAQRCGDALAELGEMTQLADANIIKLPNISASVPQLKAAIAELQGKGYALPDYPDSPATDVDRDARARYDSVKGSAVNPVLREGNSDRRAPRAVKEYARNNPHRMGAWTPESKTHVATMAGGDFRANEKSVTVSAPTTARIEHVAADGAVTVLKDKLALEAGEIIDGTFMSKKALVAFLEAQILDAKKQGVLFSLHLKATMMKVSDPIIFGHAVRVFYKAIFEKYGAKLEALGANANNGFASILSKVASLPEAERAAFEADVAAVYASAPAIAMVNSDRGITNLHVPSDVIIDASLPPLIRDSGGMWNAEGKLQDCKATIPDSSYAGVYAATVADCKANGAYDPATMGSVSNVGLMAKKAQEYGSHDKTFEMVSDGVVRVVDGSGTTLIEHRVEAGDIWRACQVKDAPVRDWVKLAVSRARATAVPTLFWLDKGRAHDAQLIKKVELYLKDHDTEGLDIRIMTPPDATTLSVERIRKGQDTVSVTGNVLRDYLTDLFPILEVGTSAKMLSIVPLMKGGGLFETGAGGSAPKHVQQFEQEGHLRWDSLGEFLAIAVSLEHLSQTANNPGAKILGETLDTATSKLLANRKSPSRKVKELDNRGSHFYLALYWAEALAGQSEDTALAAKFAPVLKALANAESSIVEELNSVQGGAQDVGGYYKPDAAKLESAMRPSATLNAIIDGI